MKNLPESDVMPTPPDGEWKTGWPLVCAAFVGIFTAVLYVYSTGLFIEPLQSEFGWSRATVTGGMMVVGVAAAMGNPLIGSLVDRTSPGRIALAGSIAYAASLAMLGFSGPGQTGWWIGWSCVAIASLAISVPVWLVAVVRHFDRSRGKALAVGYCGSSLAAITVPFFTRTLIDDFGWRGAYFGLGLLALLAGGAASAILITRDRNQAKPPRGERKARFTASARRALAGSTFLRIAVMCLLVTLGVIGLTVHFVAICADKGIGRSEAAGLAGLIGIAGIVGRLATGMLLDRFSGRVIGAIVFLVPASACALLWLGSPGLAGMALIALAIGASLGAELDIMAFLTARYFPLGDYGVLFGVLTGIVGCAAGFGPLFASLLRDLSGSYGNLAMVLTLGFAASSALVASLAPYPGSRS